MCEFLAVSFPGANLLLKSAVLYILIIRQKFGFKTLGSFLSTHNQFLKQPKFLQLTFAFIFFAKILRGSCGYVGHAERKFSLFQNVLNIRCFSSLIWFKTSSSLNWTVTNLFRIWPHPPSPWVQIASGGDVAIVGFGVEGVTWSGAS